MISPNFCFQTLKYTECIPMYQNRQLNSHLKSESKEWCHSFWKIQPSTSVATTKHKIAIPLNHEKHGFHGQPPFLSFSSLGLMKLPEKQIHSTICDVFHVRVVSWVAFKQSKLKCKHWKTRLNYVSPVSLLQNFKLTLSLKLSIKLSPVALSVSYLSYLLTQ